MSKTSVLVNLDSELVNQIQSVLPQTRFESVEAAIADVVVDGITGSYSAWTKCISWEPSETEEEPSPATEISSDSFHITADRAYSAASEILGVAESQDTDTSQAKAALRHKVIELGRLLDDMRRYVGVPVAVSHTENVSEKLETAIRDCRILYSTLTAISAVDCVNEKKLDEAILTDIAELLRDQASKIWSGIEDALSDIRWPVAGSDAMASK